MGAQAADHTSAEGDIGGGGAFVVVHAAFKHDDVQSTRLPKHRLAPVAMHFWNFEMGNRHVMDPCDVSEELVDRGKPAAHDDGNVGRGADAVQKIVLRLLNLVVIHSGEF